jgi:hypothetical protein
VDDAVGEDGRVGGVLALEVTPVGFDVGGAVRMTLSEDAGADVERLLLDFAGDGLGLPGGFDAGTELLDAGAVEEGGDCGGEFWLVESDGLGRMRKYTTRVTTKIALSTSVDVRAGMCARHQSRIGRLRRAARVVRADRRSDRDALAQQRPGDPRA